VEPPAVLVITQGETELTPDYGEGYLVRLRPDGRKVKRAGASIETRAQWKNRTLVVESETDVGSKLTTTYSLQLEPRRLLVEMRLQPPQGGPVAAKLVYDAADDGTGQPGISSR
jgi:hypothetical protein